MELAQARHAFITGGASGIGLGIADALARRGIPVTVADINEEALASVAGTRGNSLRGVRLDTRDREGWRAARAEAEAALGPVDILVNNAGIGTAVPATRETPDEFRQVIDINLNGSYWMAQACGRVMAPGSSIINISSVLGITTAGLPQAAYAASKAGIIGLTRDLAQQWTGRKGIRVNAIAPGFFASEMTDTYPPGYLDAQKQRIPAGRKGDARELAATVVYLASDAAGYVTGQTLAVDGGLTIT